MAAATGAEIKTRLAGLLKQASEATLAAYWTDHCNQAATFADQEVKGGLYKRGFIPDDVADWVRLHEITLDLGLWRAIMLGGIFSSFDATVIKALDRRDELDSILVFVDRPPLYGVWIQPPSGNAGTSATGGPLADDPDATFNSVQEIDW